MHSIFFRRIVNNWRVKHTVDRLNRCLGRLDWWDVELNDQSRLFHHVRQGCQHCVLNAKISGGCRRHFHVLWIYHIAVRPLLYFPRVGLLEVSINFSITDGQIT